MKTIPQYPYGELVWKEIPRREEGKATYECRVGLGIQWFNNGTIEMVSYGPRGCEEAYIGDDKVNESELQLDVELRKTFTAIAKVTGATWSIVWVERGAELDIHVTQLSDEHCSIESLNRAFRGLAESYTST